jgi:hypothetical protein
MGSLSCDILSSCLTHPTIFVVVKTSFPLHNAAFHCTRPERSAIWISAKERRKLCQSGGRRASQAPRAASCQVLFLCCFNIYSPHFPQKGERVRAISASHGGNPSPLATHRCRSVMPTSSASCPLEQPPPTRAGESETRSPDRRNKSAREQCRRAGQGGTRTRRGAELRSWHPGRRRENCSVIVFSCVHIGAYCAF